MCPSTWSATAPLPAPQLRRGPAQRPVRHPVAGAAAPAPDPTATGCWASTWSGRILRAGDRPRLRASSRAGSGSTSTTSSPRRCSSTCWRPSTLVADQGWKLLGDYVTQPTAWRFPAGPGRAAAAPARPPLRRRRPAQRRRRRSCHRLRRRSCPATSTRPAACWPPPPATATAPPAAARPVGRLRGAAPGSCCSRSASGRPAAG